MINEQTSNLLQLSVPFSGSPPDVVIAPYLISSLILLCLMIAGMIIKKKNKIIGIGLIAASLIGIGFTGYYAYEENKIIASRTVSQMNKTKDQVEEYYGIQNLSGLPSCYGDETSGSKEVTWKKNGENKNGDLKKIVSRKSCTFTLIDKNT